MKRSGTADLPLHGGHIPEWLAQRMTKIGREILCAIARSHGQSEVLTRMSDPFWFQALGCVMGMDWHSSGITTSVMGALKHAVNPISHELGIYICGGRGKHSLRTPEELRALADRKGLDGNALVHASRLSAKIDNTCVQDGFSLYLHSFVVTDKGEWAVVQQGMNPDTGMARRYHWHSSTVRSFVDDPHDAIVGENLGRIVNLSDARSAPAREGIVDFLSRPATSQLTELRRLVMPREHQVLQKDINSRRLGAVLAVAHERQFRTFTDALMMEGVGPRTMQALALVGEVIYGAKSRFDDPARFAFAHGGKDGAPFPVPLAVYDESIDFLRKAVDKAKLGRPDKIESLRKLTALTRLVEREFEPHADVQKLIRHEWDQSARYGGRTVFGPARPKRTTGSIQLSLFDSAPEE